MKRRDFLSQTAVAATALGLTGSAGAQTPTAPAAHRFKLKYAPHIGMFENSAGKDPLDQIRFMADAGFRAFEDNGMMKRPIALQQQMGDLLAKRGMTMGVFVIDGGDNWKVSLDDRQTGVHGRLREGLPRRGRGRQAHEREVDDGRARLLRAEPADRHPDRARHRRASAAAPTSSRRTIS